MMRGHGSDGEPDLTPGLPPSRRQSKPETRERLVLHVRQWVFRKKSPATAGQRKAKARNPALSWRGFTVQGFTLPRAEK
jgi:hypothetical protein